MMDALKIIAESWPIAAMVIGIGAAITIRRSIRQMLDNRARQDEYRASQAVTIRGRDE